MARVQTHLINARKPCPQAAVLCAVLVVLVVPFFNQNAIAQLAPTVQDLVAAHDSTLQLIQSADIEVVFQQAERFDAADADFRYRDSRKYHLLFSGAQQRLTEVALGTPRPSTGFYTDSYTDGRVRWTLLDYDRDRPPRITPLKTTGAEGGIILETVGRIRSPLEFMLLLFRPGSGKPLAGNMLRHFVTAFERAEVSGQELIEENRCWKLRLHGPAPSLDLSDPKDFVDLFIDPQAGFRVRQQNVHFAHFNIVNPSGNGTTIGTYDSVSRVGTFREHAPGVFLPEEGLAWVVPETRGRLLIGRCTFKVNSVNAPVAAAAFHFEFPEYLRVADLREPSNPKLYVWDKENKPGVQFTSTDDLLRFRHLDRAPSRWKIFASVIAVLLTITALSTIVYRKYREVR